MILNISSLYFNFILEVLIMSKVFFIVGFVIGFELFLAITAENIILAIPSIALVLASVAVLLYVYGLDFKAIVNVFRGAKR
jgi:hypothetical protein